MGEGSWTFEGDAAARKKFGADVISYNAVFFRRRRAWEMEMRVGATDGDEAKGGCFACRNELHLGDNGLREGAAMEAGGGVVEGDADCGGLPDCRELQHSHRGVSGLQRVEGSRRTVERDADRGPRRAEAFR